MARVFILVEGETEEDFVNEILAPHLYHKGYQAVTVKLMGNARQRNRRGGIKGWTAVRQEIIRYLNTDPSIYISTMADYYALPKGGNNGWPGRFESPAQLHSNKAKYVENALKKDISDGLSPLASNRFIPYVMMHEFEGLLFSDCQAFARSIGHEDLIPALQSIRDKYDSPEEINDSPETHPSKRIIDLVPEYEKPLYGNLAAMEIGLSALRKECPGFDRWLKRLEDAAQ
ncbi:MAG: DUF4276 family protein [Cyanothece sp. SIO2G6]|nr:DUF4276 family protein [Cyanothece sp. SIO2G6]